MKSLLILDTAHLKQIVPVLSTNIAGAMILMETLTCVVIVVTMITNAKATPTEKTVQLAIFTQLPLVHMVAIKEREVVLEN